MTYSEGTERHFRGVPPVGWRAAPERDEFGLTAIDRDTLVRLASGRSYTQIAADLGLAQSSMGSRARTAIRALGVDNRAEAVARARELGLIPSEPTS